MHIVTPHWERTLTMKAWSEGSDKTFITILSPLLNISAQALVNLTDPSAYLTLMGEYSISQNVTLSTGISRGLGESSEGTAGELSSEFTSWPGTYFASAGYYF